MRTVEETPSLGTSPLGSQAVYVIEPSKRVVSRLYIASARPNVLSVKKLEAVRTGVIKDVNNVVVVVDQYNCPINPLCSIELSSNTPYVKLSAKNEKASADIRSPYHREIIAARRSDGHIMLEKTRDVRAGRDRVFTEAVL